METVADAKKYLHDNWKQGVKCPCCGQMVKLYKRRLNSAAALCLIDLLKKSGGKAGVAVHITEIGKASTSGGNFAQLAHWDLIKPIRNTDTPKRTSGKWCITAKGVDFVRSTITVPAYTFQFDGKCLGFSDERISIKQALGVKFNYSDLMAGV